MRLSKKAEALFSTSSWNSYHGNMLPISGREKASNGLSTSSLQSSTFHQSCGSSYKQLNACLTDIIYAKHFTLTAQSTTKVTSECNKIHQTTSQHNPRDKCYFSYWNEWMKIYKRCIKKLCMFTVPDTHSAYIHVHWKMIVEREKNEAEWTRRKTLWKRL